MTNYVEGFLNDISEIVQTLKLEPSSTLIDEIVSTLKETNRANGRLFIIGMGGSAATASHAVNDFRKIAGIDAICPLDNVAELTAYMNDVDWETCISNQLKTSNLNFSDTLLILSGSGGRLKKDRGLYGPFYSSEPLLNAAHFAKTKKAQVISIIGNENGEVGKHSNIVLTVPYMQKEDRLFAYVESMHSVLLHLIVNHPDLKEL